MAHSATDARSTQDETVSEAVVYAVAEQIGSDPSGLEPLHSAVDPDALNRLFDRNQFGLGGSPARVTFTYAGCEVVISADGTVQVSQSGGETTRHWR